MANKVVIINTMQETFQEDVKRLNNFLEDDWEIDEFDVYNDCIFYYLLEKDQ